MITHSRWNHDASQDGRTGQTAAELFEDRHAENTIIKKGIGQKDTKKIPKPR